MVAWIVTRVGKTPDDAALRDALAELLDGRGGDRSGKIYGLGHAIYTMSDPRALAVKENSRRLIEDKGLADDLALLEAIERIGIPMIMEKTGREVPMCANVDLYSGLAYEALGIPPALCTPLFAIARVAGWCAHRIEELATGGRIMRPAYRSSMREIPYVPIAARRGEGA